MATKKKVGAKAGAGAKKYFTTVFAALIVMAIVLGAFIYSLIMGTPTDIGDIIYDDSSALNPSGDLVPSGPPNVVPPVNPPPGM